MKGQISTRRREGKAVLLTFQDMRRTKHNCVPRISHDVGEVLRQGRKRVSGNSSRMKTRLEPELTALPGAAARPRANIVSPLLFFGGR